MLVKIKTINGMPNKDINSRSNLSSKHINQTKSTNRSKVEFNVLSVDVNALVGDIKNDDSFILAFSKQKEYLD